MTGPPVTAGSRLTLHPLRFRRDRAGWCVGRVETGDFVAVPDIGARAIRELAAGHTVGQVQRGLSENGGPQVDVLEFATALSRTGLVAAVDGRALPGPAVPPASLAWLRPRWVRWTLSPAAAYPLAALVLAAGVAMVLDPDLLPTGRDLLWSPRGSFVLAGNAALSWLLVYLHELAHLVTARAAGVPGRITLSTRLQFLAAQTDVTGVWAADRRTRLTVYLAGIAVNLGVAAGAVLLRAATDPGPVRDGLGALALLSLLLIPPQALVFTRTDLYFLLQDLTGCRNLYGDGGRYLAYLLRASRSRLTGGPTPLDPSAALPAGERRSVRYYAGLLVVGTAGCLGIYLTVALPVLLHLVATALAGLAGGSGTAAVVDAALVLLVVGGYAALWAGAWWRRHGRRVGRLGRWVTGPTRPPTGITGREDGTSQGGR